jgi:PAS domain S-box-containing protein
MDEMKHFLSADGFMPHGMCYLWQPGILGLHVVSDSLITLAYFSIPFTLLYFVRRRADLQFNWIFVCFAVFIVACGTTHLMEVWTIWHATYWLSGTIKAITALASVPTAILLVKLVPVALRVPSASALQNANSELEREVTERKRAEGEVRRINAELEARVAERTAQLEAANQSLLREVRERQRAEETIRSAQQLLQAIVDNSMAVIYVKDLSGRYLLVNRRYEDIFHLTREAILGRTDHDLFPQAAADAFRAMDERVALAGKALTEEETVPQVDGAHTYLSVKFPLLDATGRPYAVTGISTDITERRQAEQRLRSQLAKLDLLSRTTRAIGERQDVQSILQVAIRSLEEHLPIDFGCVCLYESEQRVLTVACVGVKSQPLALQLAMPEQARIEIDQNGLSRCVRGQLVYEPDITQLPFAFPRRLAHAGLGSLVAAPLMLESKVFGVVLTARREVEQFTSSDCEFLRQLSEHLALAMHQAELHGALQRAYDDLRQSQQSVMQQERLRVIGQLASGIAHDINNALSPAALYAQSLLERDTSLSQQAKDYLVVIQRAIEGVAHTVARMKEFYRHREPQRVHEPVELNRVLEQVIDLTRARWSAEPQQRGLVIQMQTDLAPALPAITGAESEIRDALTNLILNAVDAMPEGGTLTVRTQALEPNQVRVEVRDTGIGMDEATRTRCLEPFFTTKGERGTGLGLAMVYGMLQRHGGEVQIESEPGQGTSIRLVFPCAVAGTATGDGSGVFRTVPPSQPLRILFVDDDPIMLKSLRDTLEQDGHVVVVADGGQRGIETFRAAQQCGESFAAVITDLGMPHVDGRTVAIAIKSAAPTVPVILLTGWGHRLLAENDMPAGVDRVLSKPPKLGALRLALAELTAESPA